MKTTKGYRVFGLQPSFDTTTYSYSKQSGRVRAVEGNPYFDQYVRWEASGKAIGHDFGDLDKGSK